MSIVTDRNSREQLHEEHRKFKDFAISFCKKKQKFIFNKDQVEKDGYIHKRTSLILLNGTLDYVYRETRTIRTVVTRDTSLLASFRQPIASPIAIGAKKNRH